MSLTTAVILCTRDRPRLVEDAVDSILAGSVLPTELAIVDQSSHSETLRLPRRDDCRVTHIRTPTLGLGRARNIGTAQTRSDVLAYCDDDVIADAEWLAALVAPLQEGDVRTVATGRVLPGASERPGSFVPAVVLEKEPATFAGRLDRDVLAGGNCALFRETLELVGGWDERLGAGSSFPAAEDNDLGFRLLEAGCRIVYVPDAVLHHRSWRPGRQYPQARWRYGVGKGGFYAKHAREPRMARRALLDVGRRPGRFVTTVARRPLYAIGELAYAAGVVIGSGRWLAHSRRRR